jgi:hypothetical protein
MRRWELWSGETGSMFIRAEDDESPLVTEAIEEGWQKTWECVAKGTNDAMRQMYAHQWHGEYKPMLRDDGTPYPEDEDDDYEVGSSAE